MESTFFEYIVLFMGPKEQSIIRRGKELELIIQDRDLCYICENRAGEANPFLQSSHETKKKNGEATGNLIILLLGDKLVLNIIYPSIAEASRQTGIARKQFEKSRGLNRT
jgi:hypothetical protein